MAEVENRALQNLNVVPSLYAHYIDNIFVICEKEELLALRDEMMNTSGLTFTIERSVDSKLPFLNVLVEKTDGTVKSSVFRKPGSIQSVCCQRSCSVRRNSIPSDLLFSLNSTDQRKYS